MLEIDSMFSVPRGTLDTLRVYEALLHKWQKAINLVGPASLPDAWTRHFIDSLQLLPLLPETGRKLYDLGSGAGFPGLVVAVARPDLNVTLIESDQKKCAFLTTVSHETKATNVHVMNARIDVATRSWPAPDIVTARALASLSDLLGHVWPWAKINPRMVCIFPKGAQAQTEIADALTFWGFDVDEKPSITDSAATLLVITNLVKKD